MPKYEVEVIESRDYRVIYTVVARDAEHARDKAEAGFTEDECEIRLEGVRLRTTMTEPFRLYPQEEKEE